MIDLSKAAVNPLQAAFNGLVSIHGKLCDVYQNVKIPTVYRARAGVTSNNGGDYTPADTFEVPFNARRIDITLFDKNAVISIDNNSQGSVPSWGDDVQYIAPGFYSIPFVTKRLRIKDAGAGDAKYQWSAWG